MAKGQIGVSMGGSIEYTRQLKPTTKNCRNCKKYKASGRCGICRQFGITITDTTNAKYCKEFDGKKKGKPRKKAATKKKKNTGPKRG